MRQSCEWKLRGLGMAREGEEKQKREVRRMGKKRWRGKMEEGKKRND